MSKGKKKAAKKAIASAASGKQQNGANKKKQFSMVEEARHTDRGYDRISSNRRLEKRTMDFVSAGSAFQTTEEVIQRQQADPIHSRPSSPSSISSEEVILFTGRNKSALLPPAGQSPQVEISDRPVEESGTGNSSKQQRSLNSTVSISTTIRQTFSNSRPLDLSEEDEIDEEMLADYIANMDSFSDDDDSIVRNGVDKGKNPVQSLPSIIIKSTNTEMDILPVAKIHVTPPSNTQSGSSSSNQVATKAKEPDNSRSITTILSQRNGDVGMFYLVVYDNQDDDTAEWIESNHLQNMTSSALQFFESPMWETEDSESIDSEIQAERDLATMFDDEAIEDEQLKKKQSRMTDEEIAIRLAKQEEFGIDASEVVMFDGLEEPVEPIEYLRQEAVRYNLRSRKAHRRIDSEESDFDLMDYERPSLQKSKNKKNKKLGFDVFDSDMERDMLATWQNDRAKKKQRKQEREELRAQGLLGGGAKAKYPNGIALDELKEEFRAFLSSNRTTMLLPPMDKTDRKLVHEIAHNFNVKSSSDGSGHNRHATLNKKARTRPFTDEAFDAVVNRLLKRFRTTTLGRQKSSKQHFSYREGEIVASNAPEISSENRGRAMLEKMGWNTGDALGAMNNPGILNPIAHEFKGSRSGLG